MSPRLATSLLVQALVRRAESEGGFGTIVAKGDAHAGAIGVILLERGRPVSFLERALQPDGAYSWQPALSQITENKHDFENALKRRRNVDPDLWLVELDIASAERFAAEMNALG